MSLWECQNPGCSRQCIGCGGAIGLRAIGWYFMPGPVIFCPAHRPDAKRCRVNEAGRPCLFGGEDHDQCPEPCPYCTGVDEASWIQSQIPGVLEAYPPSYIDPVIDFSTRN
jgi:hypothetical protein